MTHNTEQAQGQSGKKGISTRQSLKYAEDIARLYQEEKARREELQIANEKLRLEVAQRKRTEEELRGSEERFRTVFESAQDCIFIKDRSLRYSHVNSHMQNLLGLETSSIVGRSDTDLFGPQVGEYLHDLDSRVLNGEVVEQEHTRPVGGSPSTFLDIRVPLRDGKGEIVGVFGIARDVTGRTIVRPASHRIEEKCRSETMRVTLRAALMVAQTDSTVLLTGESGCGKDFLAAYIHRHSQRARGPFFCINCAAVAPELAESELFGHEAGAFSGARGRRRGLLELAEGGTLLLNEIGHLPLRLQAKLLTFLDKRSFARVGGEKEITVRARLMVATNRDLENEVSQGRFRSDLFFRLNVFAIRIPPLRARIEDFPILVDEIISEIAAELQLSEMPEVDPVTLDHLSEYRWPGNVRELRNVLERALILSGGVALDLDSLASGDARADDWEWATPFPPQASLDDVVADLTRSLVEEALRHSGGNRQEAACLLGISRYALRRRMVSAGITGRAVHPNKS